MKTKETLTQEIKAFAVVEAGFDLVGISRAELPSHHGKAIESWVEDGFAGTMGYMVRDGKKRAHPEAILPDARSVISLAVNYHHPEDPRPEGAGTGKVAKYAYGADYHKVIGKKLKTLAQFIRQSGGEEARVKVYVDTGPVLEKAFAQAAGLGFFGKNTNIITRNYGSWVFLASILTNLELEADAPHTGSCGSCRICIDACPTQALLGDYRLDARRCISYLTIESKEPIPLELKGRLGEWAFGCDICQDVCPYNFRANTTRHEELYPKKIAGSWVELEKIEKLATDEGFNSAFNGSPIKRAKRQGLLRSLKVVIENREMVQ